LLKVSDIAASLCCGFRLAGATGGIGLLTGGNPGLGGPPEPLPCVLPLSLSFLNLLLILNNNNFNLCRKMYAIAERAAMIRIIRTHIHQAVPFFVVLVRQQTFGVLHEYVAIGSWNSEHWSMHV